jgi:DNA-binding MarR family transcriptional regulator
MTAIRVDVDDVDMQGLALALRQLRLSGEQFRGALGRHLQLGPTDFAALRHLYDEGPLTPRELSARMKITSGSVTPLLDRLEKVGYLSRNNNPHDRRSLLISSTAAGRDAIEWTEQKLDAALRQALQDLPELTPDQLITILTILARALDAGSAHQTPPEPPALHALDGP